MKSASTCGQKLIVHTYLIPVLEVKALQVLAMPAVIVILSEKESRNVTNITIKSRILITETLHKIIIFKMGRTLFLH